MLKNTLKFFKNTYHKVLRSIAFYPVLLSLVFLILAIVGLNAERYEAVKLLKENVPSFFIEDYETARAILSTLIGGVLSLTVFSFTMVMVVLNQASSNFSSRLLPNLVSDKKHQIILGIYIGTLLFSIITLIALGANHVDKNFLGMSTMFAALLGVVCIGLFVYFIHSISVSIQIHNIIDRIFDSSYTYYDKKLTETKELESFNEFDLEGFETIHSHKTGYFRGFEIGLMRDVLKQKDNQIEVLPYVDQHVWEGTPLMRVRNKLNKEELEALLFCVRISTDRHTGERGISGMVKLMEIAVKAMSPGINDPGTAIEALVKLGQLLKKVISLPEITISKVKAQAEIVVINNKISTEDVMRILVQPIRFYAKNDVSVMYELIKTMNYLLNDQQLSEHKKQVIKKELDLIKNDIENAMDNDIDKQRALSFL
ncbi:DUF2254 domain-containing protein [Allomuricauda sp. d1]|uniref:DUF2254 domain-containing protein n=1 Tax=Allomuricauda sp. d1 TaxID=3136725 RepID=UPI0031E4745C